MAGWASGSALMIAMNKYTGETLKNKVNFYNNLLEAQFLVSDLFIGSFGSSTCLSSAAMGQGALCKCHAGGNNMWFHSFAKTGTSFDTAPLRGGLFQYGLGMCAILRVNGDTYSTPDKVNEIVHLPRTVHLAVMSPSDNETVSSMCSQVQSTLQRLVNTTLYWLRSNHAVRGYCKQTAMRTASEDAKAHEET